jgi:subtilisin family serine protease
MGRLLLVAVIIAATVTAAAPSAAAPDRAARADGYIVLYQSDASLAAARLAVRAAGGTLVRENRAVGVATAISLNPRFAADLMRQAGIAGVARNKPIGRTAPAPARRDVVERLSAIERRSARPVVARKRTAPTAEPLAGLQWDMAMIHATATGSYAKQPGDQRVLVGVLDTGVDGTHPDIAPNFDAARSRNFTTDVELVDGPCADEPDASCDDPANVDENGHGTHVAGTIAAPINGLGIAGVAPNVKLVNLRAGQDSGFFFLQPSVDALTHAGDHGINVVNMSYFIDPWLYNCASNPADSPAAQLEQRAIVEATNRALDYAHKRGVTLIAAAGNQHTDTGDPTFDEISPDYPPGSEYDRTVDNACLSMPTEGNNVLSIAAVGPSGTKADYSNWGREQTTVAAPGGYFRDFAGTPQNRTVGNLVLSAYPLSLALTEGGVDPDGTPNTPFVVRDCQGGVCAYYQYLQGTSMASPHAVGVAALIVSEHGRDAADGGLPMPPVKTEKFLARSATDVQCPDPPVIDYTIVGRDRDASWNATCTGHAHFNSIWGHGLVDALKAVGR